ncbi:hypothetical protein ACHAXN_009506 [Cyclotella atomus]
MSHPLYAAPRKSKQPTEVPHTCYQIDFAAVKCGKMVAASKRRIRFKFGYTNVEALSTGATGTDCRGSEHDITITWSLSSGKQSVVLDGKEMYFDVGDTSKVKCTFKDKDEHTLQVMAHAAPMSTKSNPDPDWRQYDLLIDGISYFRYPKIYQLGVFASDDAKGSTAFAPKEMLALPGPEYGNGVLASVLPKEEERKPEPVEVADLLSFDESEVVVAQVQSNQYTVPTVSSPTNAPPSNNFAPAPTMMDYSSNQYTQNFAAAPTINPFENNQYQPTNAPTSPFENQYAPTNTDFAQPQQASPNEMAQSTTQPVQNQYSNYQMNANPFDSQPNPQPPAPADYNSYNQGVQSYNQGMPTQQAFAAPPQAPASITPNTSSQALVSAAPTNNATNMSNLVNLDNLMAPSASTIAKQAPKAPVSQGVQKKPIMNSFTPQQPVQHQQGMYGQQPMQQQGMHGQQQMGYHQQQPNMGYQYHQQQMQYPQQGYAQPGFQQSSY